MQQRSRPESYWNEIVIVGVIGSIAVLCLYQKRGRKLAKLSHQADFFGLGETVGASGSPTATDVADNDDDFQISRTMSMKTATKRKLGLEEGGGSADENQVGKSPSLTKTSRSLSTLIGANKGAIDQDVIDKLKLELKLSDDVIQQNVKLFQTFDDDHSGFLTPSELVKVRASVLKLKLYTSEIPY